MKKYSMLCITLLFWFLAHAQQSDSLVDKRIHKSLMLNEVKVRPVKGISKSMTWSEQSSLQSLTDKVLERSPGINMIRRGNFAMEPTIRSFSNGQITTTIDGMRVFGACTDRMDPISSYVEPNNLESISISFNPADNSYGSGIAGGINFNLKDPSFAPSVKVSGILGTGFETNGNAFQTLAGVEYNGEKLAFQANGIFRRSGDYHAGGGREISFSQYSKWNGSVSVKGKTGKNGYLKADYIQDEGHNIGYPALTMDVGFAKAKIAALSYSYTDPAKNETWNTKVYYNFIDHAMDDTKRPPETVAMHMDMPGTSRTFGAFSDYSFRFSKRHVINVQIDGFNNKLKAEMTMYPVNATPMFMYTLADLARTSLAANLSDRIILNNRFDVKVGGRVEYAYDYLFSNAGKEQLSGMFDGDLTRKHLVENLSFQTSFYPDANWNFTAQIAAGARPATLQEAYSFYIYNRLDAYDYIGNPDLKQEKSVNINLVTSYNRGKFSGRLNAFTYFMSNYIAGSRLTGYSTMTIGANGVKHYINIPSAKIYGSELELKWSPLSSIILSSVNTYTIGNDDEGKALPLIAPLKSINSVFYRANKKMVLNAELIANAAQRRIDTERYGETPTSSSAVLNTGISRDFSLPGAKVLKAGVTVENVFDSRYYQHLDIMKIMRPGRNFVFRLTWLL